MPAWLDRALPLVSIEGTEFLDALEGSGGRARRV
jgi:hypothetical protein